ncbi:MAG: hypothetical protein MZU95_04045 [Desulfomicrobium escambiense]|nr:hypothetical protein [Desulfomicrobium escambiense]
MEEIYLIFSYQTEKAAQLYPAGGQDDSAGVWNEDNTCSSIDKNGDYCAARIMEEGWQVKYLD